MPASALLLAARIASINLCTDEYLLLLAQPQEIASISYLAQDPLESVLWRQAKPHHANFGSVEQILKTRPDILLTMGGGGRATGLIAGRMKIRAVELRAPMSIDDVAANLRTVGAALGAPQRAEPWLRRLKALRAGQPAQARDSIMLSGGGQSLSPGSPGIRWLRMAGLSQRLLAGGKATLETLLIRPPAVLVQSSYRRAQVSAAANWLKHPVIRNMRSKRLSTDGRAWTCMGPLMIPEIERLRAAAR
jgi:iron complex transport system substrate-binding protein